MTFSSDQQLFMLVTVFLSIFGVIGIYNLFLYFVIRRRVLLDYCVFVLALMAYTSVFLLDILKISVDISGLSISTAAFSAFGGLLFCRSFFNIRRSSYPRLNFAYASLLSIGLIIMLIQLLKVILSGNHPAWDSLTSTAAALLALFTVVLFAISAIALWKKESGARLFVSSMIPMVIGITIYVSYWLSIQSEQVIVPGYGLFISTTLFCSITIQMILYSVIIGYSLKTLEQEKLDLQKDANLKLQKEVIRQTQSLMKANEQIATQKNALEASNQMKNKLFSLVSHDLRSPMAGLVNLVDLLDQKDMSPEELKPISTYAKQKIRDSVLILNRILQWSHAQLDEVKVKKQAFGLEEVIDENISLYGDQLTQKQLVVKKALYSDQVYADREMIDSIVRNLLSNSIKFSHEAGTIHVDSEKSGMGLEVRITDEGVGMDPAWFNDLGQTKELHSSTGTKGEKGIGLGLIICRDFIQMNGGTLVCESEIGKGTTFVMTLASGD